MSVVEKEGWLVEEDEEKERCVVLDRFGLQDIQGVRYGVGIDTSISIRGMSKVGIDI